MDKRYLLMLIIIIICCINLSIIVNNSDIVGSASVSAGKYIFTVPEGFNSYESNGNSTIIKNNENNISIYFEGSLSKSDSYDKLLKYIEDETTDNILSKGTLSIENITVKTVYYQNTDKNNESAFYFEKYNIPFKIIVSDFNYNADYNLTLDYVTSIIQSTHLDYKSDY